MLGREEEGQERELLRRIAGGDFKAFEDLYRIYHRRLFVFLLKLVNEQEAAELVNDVMYEIWKGAKTYRGSSRLSTWILGIAHHRALNKLRERRAMEDLEMVETMPDPRESPAAGAEQSNLREKVKVAFQRLTREHREVLELTFYQDRSYREIAQIVGCPENTVKTRMFYAKQRLQEILGQMGIGSEVL
jgi:RNA polymerase sigma-70 factor (ECF subfamily)